MVRKERLQRHAETIAAAAAAFGVGVLDLERGGTERLDIIQRGTQHKRQRYGVHHHRGRLATDADILRPERGRIERKRILKARTAAPIHRDAQIRARRLRRQQMRHPRFRRRADMERFAHARNVERIRPRSKGG